jgi:hypothetical protein
MMARWTSYLTLTTLIALLVTACAGPVQPTETALPTLVSERPSATPTAVQATVSPTAMPPTVTPEPTSTPEPTEELATESGSLGDWGPVQTREILALGVRFDLPEEFQGLPSDLDGEMAYASSDVPDVQVGVMWRDLEPPMEPEAALLPTPSRVLASEPIETAWGNGRLITLEVLGMAEEGQEAPVVGVERHVLVVRTNDDPPRAVDFYLRASSETQLEAYAGLLEGVLETATFDE